MRECPRCATRAPDNVDRCPRCGYPTRQITNIKEAMAPAPQMKPLKKKTTFLAGIFLLFGFSRDSTGHIVFAPFAFALAVATTVVVATGVVAAAILVPAVVTDVTVQSTLTFTEQLTVLGQSQNIPGQYPVKIHAHLNWACQDTDNSQAQSLSNSTTGETLKFSAACSGNYFHGHLDYTETLANIDDEISSGGSTLTCTADSATLHMTGDAGNGKSISGQFTRTKVNWACNAPGIQLVDPGFNGNWTGQIT